ncbi:MAG: hypothetical protein CW691_10155 [Candidatus Bathyarchaeum sp.]|nr:MAG: hypothetical protein CW691_10155 [Candidatus Bathyarchaeum sp.]
MNTKIVAAALVAVVVLSAVFLVALNGNQNPKEQNNNTISVCTNGGLFSVLDNTVDLVVFQGSVTEQVDITVKAVTNPSNDCAVYAVSCYDFGPDGLTFETPIQIMLYYDVEDLPEDVNENSLQIYVLNGNNLWEVIDNSHADPTTHSVSATVSHFSTFACGASASSSSAPPESEEPEDELDDSVPDGYSAQYWFKADLYHYSFKSPRILEGDHKDTYTCGVSAYWKPVSYVQFYQVKVVYNGNEPEPFGWGHDFREQDKSWVDPSLLSFREGKIFYLNSDPTYDGYIGMIGTGSAIAGYRDPDTGEMTEMEYGRLWPEGYDAFSFLTVQTSIDDYEELSDVEIGVIVDQMQTFLAGYCDGWEIWVRGVTQTEG